MKTTLTLLSFLLFSISGFSQNSVYLYGFMQNAPEESVSVQATFDSSPPVIVTLQTEVDGEILVQGFEVPDNWSNIYTSFVNCLGEFTTQAWADSSFDNIVDIPLYFNYCPDTVAYIYGCTDPNAVNYNPQATLNDGSCEYETDCDLNLLGVTINTAIWGAEISWAILNENSEVVASGSNYANDNSYATDWCLEDGCYIIELYDTYGDGWNGGSFELNLNNSTILSGTLTFGEFQNFAFGINQDGCELPPVYGCTDPQAYNFNPSATDDDGSCLYVDPPAPNDLCANAIPLSEGMQLIDNTNAIQNEGIWGECWGFGQGEAEQSSLWFTFTTPSVPASIHLESIYDGTNSLTDTQFGIFEACGGDMIYCDGNAGEGLMSAFDFACGELQENTTYILMVDGWNGDNGTCYLTYSVDTTCTSPTIFGCTDPSALNYNPQATIDDGSCQYTSGCSNVIIQLDGSSGGGANWILTSTSGYYQTGYYPGSDLQILECLEDGCYTFQLDSNVTEVYFGVIMGNQMIMQDVIGTSGYTEFQIGNGCDSTNVIYGCTDPLALNYNPEANMEDGSCQYEEAPCDFNAVTLTISTGSWSDEISWNLLKDGIEIEGDGVYQDNDLYTYTWCLEDGCYTFEMFDSYGDGWNGGSFLIAYNDLVIASGGLVNGQEYGTVTFGVNQEGCAPVDILGCTDPFATNYNPDATQDDGSCQYQNACTEVMIQLDGMSGVGSNWSLSSTSGYYSAGYYQGSDLQIFECLEDGCYTFQLDSNVTEVYFGAFVDNQMIAQGVIGTSGSVEFQMGSGCDSTNVVYGCTDPSAINYNPEATTDDGSCVYISNCDISFTLLPDSLGGVIWILPSGNIIDAVSVLWDFGDGVTSTEMFPQHTYEDEGPYTLCLTVSFVDDSGNSCSVTYCTEVSGVGLGDPGFSSTGFTINVTNNANPTGINDNSADFSPIELWPNPVSNQLSIRFENPNKLATSLSVFDITGKLLEQKSIVNTAGDGIETIDVSNLPSGVYILKMANSKTTQTGHFVKTN